MSAAELEAFIKAQQARLEAIKQAEEAQKLGPARKKLAEAYAVTKEALAELKALDPNAKAPWIADRKDRLDLRIKELLPKTREELILALDDVKSEELIDELSKVQKDGKTSKWVQDSTTKQYTAMAKVKRNK